MQKEEYTAWNYERSDEAEIFHHIHRVRLSTEVEMEETWLAQVCPG